MPTRISFYSRGLKLAADLYTPAAPGRAPGILLCQGLSGVRSLVLPAAGQAFAAAGFVALAFDYSGFGDSEGERGWLDPFARADDALAAFTFLRAQTGVDPERCGVYGLSLGGMIALAVAACDPAARAVACVPGFASGERLLRNLRTNAEWLAFEQRLARDRTQRALTGRGEWAGAMDIVPLSPALQAKYAQLKAAQGTHAVGSSVEVAPQQYALAGADRFLRFDVTPALARIDAAVLLVHGALDDAIAVAEGERVYAALSGPKRFQVFDSYDHIDLDCGVGLTQQLTLATDWFREHLAQQQAVASSQ